jgi:hypothetical protein
MVAATYVGLASTLTDQASVYCTKDMIVNRQPLEGSISAFIKQELEINGIRNRQTALVSYLTCSIPARM